MFKNSISDIHFSTYTASLSKWQEEKNKFENIQSDHLKDNSNLFLSHLLLSTSVMEKVSSKSEFNLQIKDWTKGFLLFLFLLYYTVKQLFFIYF